MPTSEPGVERYEDRSTESLIEEAEELKETIERSKIAFDDIAAELYHRDELPEWAAEYGRQF